MRYYNENPQVTLWREKFEALKDENLSLKYECKHVRVSAELWKGMFLKVEESNAKYMKQVVEGNREKRHFNSLPWYKKMFYKFKI